MYYINYSTVGRFIADTCKRGAIFTDSQNAKVNMLADGECADGECAKPF